jgi:hypothetical protein
MQTIESTNINAAVTQGDVANDNTHDEPLKFSKRIGSTTFIVAVHQSKTSRDTAQDKIKRLIEREVRESA